MRVRVSDGMYTKLEYDTDKASGIHSLVADTTRVVAALREALTFAQQSPQSPRLGPQLVPKEGP
jgi:hypothetical protein